MNHKIRFGALSKSPSGTFELTIPKYSASSEQSFTWIGRDMGPSVVALFKHRNRKEINNQAFPVVTAKMTYPEFAKILQKCTSSGSLFIITTRSKCEFFIALGKEVKFVSPPTSGSEEFDEMVRFHSCFAIFGSDDFDPVRVPVHHRILRQACA